MTTFRWLHLTDIHTGMAAQDWLWPRFRTDLMEDLARSHERSGPWDTLIFSGDIARTGLQAEFEQFTEIIRDVLERCSSLGSDLEIITTPGNHDLTRPQEINPHFISMGQYETNEAIRKDFWGDDAASNRTFINDRFKNYTTWRAEMIEEGIHARPCVEGMLAGDASYEIAGKDGTARICSLNSTWMQLADGDYTGRLVVDAMQLLKITNKNPDAWLSQADFAIMVTHQPTSWLNTPSIDQWQSDIYTPDRFDLHAFGHMHQAATSSQSFGGSEARRSAQGASLFGYEKTALGWERIQGYSSYKLGMNQAVRELEGWPRRLISMQSGVKKLRPDNTFELDEGSSSFKIDYRRAKPNTERIRPASLPKDAFQTTEDTAPFDVRNIEVKLRPTASHDKVRLAEQDLAAKAWADANRAFWLKADWGLGSEAFIASIIKRIGVPALRTFKLSVAGFTDRQSFLDKVRVTYGVTYEEICNFIEQIGNSVLIFDDATAAVNNSDCADATDQLEAFVSATKDYLAETRFVISTRIAPVGSALPIIELLPLDEPDTRSYVEAAASNDHALSSAAAIEKIFKLTDGHPGRLDAALRQLQVVPLSELAMTNTDLSVANVGVKAPVALSTAISELQSVEGIGKRSFELLNALSAFPHGEQLERVKRFEDKSQFFPQHATALLDRSLIDSISYSKMGEQPGLENARLLSVARPVREYVRSLQSDEGLAVTDRKAIDLYFGEGWKSGLATGTIAARIADNPLAAPYELANANTLLVRILKRSQDSNNILDEEGAIRASATFITRVRTR